MSMYEYIDPTTVGLTKFKLTRKQHNEIFKYSKRGILNRVEYYYNDDKVLIHRFDCYLAKGLNTILFPFLILYVGFKEFPNVLQEYKRMYFDKKYGAFVEYIYWAGNTENTYTHILNCLQKE